MKASHVEGLRDSYGFYLHAYRRVLKWATLGGEFKYLVPEDRQVKEADMHVLFGTVFHLSESTELSFGFQHGINREDGFSRYGFLAGLLYRF